MVDKKQVNSKLEHSKDYKNKLVKDKEHFSDKISTKKDSKDVAIKKNKNKSKYKSFYDDKVYEKKVDNKSNSTNEIEQNIVKTDDKSNEKQSVEKTIKSVKNNKRRNYSDVFTRKNLDKKIKKHNKELKKISKLKKDKNVVVDKNKIKKHNVVSASSVAVREYLRTSEDDNKGVEAGEKVANSTYKVSNKLKNFRDKRKINNNLREKKSKLNFKKSTNATNKAKQKAQVKKMYKRNTMKDKMYKGQKNKVKKKVKEGLSKIIKIAKEVIARKGKGILLLIIGILLALVFFINIIGISFMGLINSNSSILSSTYLANEQELLLVNHNYSTMELNLENEIDRVEDNYPGYDEYIVNGADIEHDTHELLAYITSRYGEIDNIDEVENELASLFNEVYDLSYDEDIETRYRTKYRIVINDLGEEEVEEYEEEYEYKKLIVTLNKKNLDSIIRQRLAGYEDNLKHYDTLLDSKGNMEDFFPSNSSNFRPNGVSSIYSYEVDNGRFPPPDETHVASLNGGYAGQCTWYVYNRFSQLGKPIKHSPMGNGGEWAFYAQQYGYNVSRNAKVGYAMSFPPGLGGSSPRYGHIAFVEKVNSDGSVLISEMNVYGEFVISTRTISKDMASRCYYIDFGL